MADKQISSAGLNASRGYIIKEGKENEENKCRAITQRLYKKSGFISDMLHAENDTFEIEMLIDALRQAVNECGELVVKIPQIKFVSPEEKTLSFNAADISKLKQYFTNEIEMK